MKAVNEKLRRAVCSILAFAMALSLVSVPGFSGAAKAAPEASPSSEIKTDSPFRAVRHSELSALAADDGAEGGIMPYSSAITDVNASMDKPTLFIDFLGDSMPGYGYTGFNSGAGVPSDRDQSAWQQPNPPDAWKKYGPQGDTSGDCTPTVPGTVFWVGVGIDRMRLFELSKEGRGLTGVELGFYYDPRFVAPYTGANTAAPYAPGSTAEYKTVLENANLGANELNQWSPSAYEIVEAIPEREPVLDSLDPTQESLFKKPTNQDMIDDGWKMLYVSLEKKDSDWDGAAWHTPNRFLHADAAYPDETHYIMMLPFVLKDHDPNLDICFRLSRNASLFSMGGGREGADTYDSVNSANHSFGAWERKTQTPNHNLKEMFSFEGDLNIFTGENVPDQYQKATLHLDGAESDPGNTAKLYPSADPGIYVDKDLDYIAGLSMGDELTLEVSKAAGHTVSITITRRTGTTSSAPLSYAEVTPGSKYTFVMPGGSDVDVTVRYHKDIKDKNDYTVHLVKSDPNDPPLPENKAEAKGTDSLGTENVTVMEPVAPAPVVDSIKVAPDNTVTVTVEKHPDYKAVVEAKTLGGTGLTLAQPDPQKTVYTFDMPTADVEVTVTYEKLPRHYAELSVDAVSDVDPANKAKLSYKEYSEQGGTVTAPVECAKELNGHDGGREELGPIPAGREVRLDIDVLPGYMVSEIRLYNGDDSGKYSTVYTDLMADPGLTMTTSEQGYLTFKMPDNRVQVHVVFAARRNYTAKLFLQNGESAEMWGNKDGADDGSGPNPPVLNKTDMTATPKANAILAWPGNEITVDLDAKTGYVIESVTITWGSNNKIVYPAAGDSTGTIPDPVKFVMPAADVNVFVKFKKEEAFNATLVYHDLLGSGSLSNAYDNTQSGWPKDTGVSPVVFDRPTKYDINAGQRSTAWVKVQPGWYIASVWVEGWDSSPGGTNTGSGIGYPVARLSGNGYNNGAGGRVEIDVIQPNEDLTVHVDLRKGQPPVEPEYTLKLQVDDPANTAAPLANNWAQVTVNGVGPQPTPAVSVSTSNPSYLMPNATYPTPITAGQLVEITYDAAPGYTVTGVTVTPGNLGVVPAQVSANKVRFYMPKGSAVATVHFAKRDPNDPPPYKATLHLVGPAPAEWGEITNTASSLNTRTDGDSVAAWPGDTFRTDAGLAGSSHWVTVDVYQGGSVVSWTEDNYPGLDGKGEFVMPAGDVDVYMTFGDTMPPAPDEHTLALTAYGPAGSAVGDAGEVDLTVDGAAAGSVKSDETPVPTLVKRVPENDTVRIAVKPNTGYVVDKIVYTSASAVTPRVLVPLAAPPGNQVEEFEMPADAVGIEVYFRVGSTDPDDPDGPQRHTANIVLRMEGNPTAVVDTTVVGDAQFDDLVPGGGYSKAAVAGTRLDIEALARNGYYISRIEITPKSLGVKEDITGVFASQDLDFIMPDADCTVNVYFNKGWPDEAELWANLRVHGPSGVPNNNARLSNVTAGVSAAAAIIAGQNQSLQALVGQEMRVKISIESGYRLVTPISVKDSAGTDVPYWWSSADEITFRMPNTWTTVDVTFEKDDPDAPVELKATLYNRATSFSGRLTRTNDSLITTSVPPGANGSITPLKSGDTIEITVTSVPVGKVPVVLVRTVSGVTIPVPAWTETGGIYTTAFAMQDEDVEVYLTEADKPGVLPNEHLATLVVNEYGTTVPDPANQASMTDAAIATVTGSVSANGSAGIRAVVGDTVTVHIDGIAAGYAVRSVEVRTTSGLLVALAQTDGETYTYTMPAEDVVAVVTFEKHDPDDPDQSLTAQVVVDKAGGAGNNAVIRKMGDTASGVTMLTGLQPKDQIEVCITVQSGYRVQLVKARATDGQVVSVSPLPLAPEQSQNVSFYMPNDDVIVFVRFVTSSELHKITLDVEDHTTPTPNLNNTAAIHTGYSGWSSYINDPATPVTVQGTVNDMVKVEVKPESGYYAVVYAVSDDVSVIPVSDLTLDYGVDPNGKTYTFSVPNNDVKVTVHFYPDSVPKPQHKVRLHIVGAGGLAGKSMLDYCILPDTAVWQVSAPTNTTNAPTTMDLTVDYLEKVAAKALAKNGYYLQSAYAMVGGALLTADPGTTNYIPSSTVPFTGKEFRFTMQNTDVDVYMVFTDQIPAGPYTAALKVTGPADTDWKGRPVYGAAGSAVLTNTGATPNVSTNTVLSNQPHNPATDSVTAAKDDTLTVEVKVNPGYSIDRVVVTPLALTLTPTSVTTNAITGVKTYTYTMPAADIEIDVRLKSDDVDRYKVTLHLKDDYLTANPSAVTSVNKAKVSYTVYELTADGAHMNVPDSQYVCVETDPGAGYYVYRAYAITKEGTVLPLVDKSNPSQILPLQYPNDRPPAPDNHKAWFKMPAEDVDVYIDFTTTPPVGMYSAVLTVLDNDPTHASSATMSVTRAGGVVDSVMDTSLPGSSAPLSVNANELIKVTLNLAPGWALDSITVTGGVTNDVTPAQSPTNPSEYTFYMPAHDVGVVVKLKSSEEDGYKATLHVVDHSSATGNQVVMKDTNSGRSVNAGSTNKTIDALAGDETIETKVTPQPGVVVRSVIATDATGSHILPVSATAAGTYLYDMDNHDVDITVVFDNDDPDVPDMFLAIVEKTGAGAAVATNTAAVTNTSNPALPSGMIWTGIYGEDPMQRLRVDVTTAPGYSAIITARTKDVSGNDVTIPVFQLALVSTVTGYLDVPKDLYDNVIITVEYRDSQQAASESLRLRIIDPNNSAANTAEISELSSTKLSVNGAGPTSDGPATITVGNVMTLTTNVAVGYLKKAELISNGMTLTLSIHNNTANFRMPNTAAEVVVTLAAGDQTPRPHDNLHHTGFPGGVSDPLYINGYLTGQNLGGNRARIQVPNLFYGGTTPPNGTVPAFNAPANRYEYKLYLKSGESYVELKRGVDYDVTSAGSYAPGPDNATTGVTDPNTGWDFQIRSLKGESALTELLLKGGVMYITATDVTNPAAPLPESEYVEVVIPADTNAGKYTATLKIVDTSGITGNQASMTINTTTVSTDGAQITKLRGDELIRTQAKPAAGARVSAVTVTDKGGTRLISQIPPGMDPLRYPYYMTGEDVIITVYFEAEEDPDNPDATHYIAAVSKHGEIAVSGNDASIKNDSRNDLLKGAIWAEGNKDNAMRVTVNVAAGYYATVKAYRKDQGTPTGDLPLVVFGAGPGVTSFDALFTMPAADVQVEVTFTTDEPENLENDLTLRLMGNYGADALNAARLQRQSDKVYLLEADADVTTIIATPEDTETDVPAGTLFDLFTSHAADRYVEKVVVKVTTTPASAPFTLTLDSTGASKDFAMPLGKTEVEVYFKKKDVEPRTPRPYDPLHSVAYNSPAYTAGSAADLSSPTQEGWILATGEEPDVNGRKQIKVLVPTLHDDEYIPISDEAALESADIVSAGGTYKFYWYDGFNYQELIRGTDILVATEAKVTDAYTTTAGGVKLDGYEMTLTNLRPGSILEYYIKRGGRIYVTSNKAPSASPSQESDYTQVIIPRTYTATLHHKLVDGGVTVSGTGAKMEAWGQSTTTDNDSLSGTNGAEVVKVNSITAPTGYHVDGVVATTVFGTVNVLEGTTPGQYEYTMVNEDVDVYVVYKKDDDPLKEKGPWIATVVKKNDGGMAANSATIKDVDVTIPAHQRGNIWTTAYEGNVVRVDVTTEPGWHAVITAETAGANGPVKSVTVTPFVTGAQNLYGLFYMENDHVNVTVEYINDPDFKPEYDLTLEVKDTDSDPLNSAVITLPSGAVLAANGGSVSAGPIKVEANTPLDLVTTIGPNHSVKSVKMEVNHSGILIDVPLVDGASVPVPVMPMGNTVITVYFQRGVKTARPYDPDHSVAYNAAGYPVPNTNPDLSETGMEGWILAERRDDTHFKLTVPTLHDNKGADPAGTLYDAGDAADQPSYKLYWKDSMGIFQELKDGVDIDVTIPTDPIVKDAYTHGGVKYDGYTFNVAIRLVNPTSGANANTVGTFWGGYTLQEYVKNGGSIYITSTGGASGALESEKTEVVFSRTDTYTATLHHKLVDNTVTPPVTVTTTATMSEGTTDVTADGGQIIGLEGEEEIRVHNVSVGSGYHVVGVIATTDVGSKNVLLDTGTGEYKYKMVHKDVDFYVVYKRDDDPLREKGPWIATVIKEDDADESANTARIKDLDVDIPAHQKGDIWTAAYDGNVVRVDVTTVPGWYAVITAETVGANGPVKTVDVAQFVNTGAPDSYYGLFYMPDDHVNVTVKYVKQDPDDPKPSFELTLEKVDAAGVTGNKATLEAVGVGAPVSVDGATLTARVPDAATLVPMGTVLKLATEHAAGYYVVKAQMSLDGFPTLIDIPLIDGNALPDAAMPMGNAKVIVTFAPGDQTPRPYDPDHSLVYNSANYPVVPDNPDLSQTHMDGWLLAEKDSADTTGTKFKIHVPTLHQKNAGVDALTDAGAAGGNPAPTYKLYWKDNAGVFHELKDGVDVDVTSKYNDGTYTHGASTYESYTLNVEIKLVNPPTDPNANTVGTFWGGYTLQEYMKKGGSIYITSQAPGANESEKTEVVFRSEAFEARLHIVNHSSHPTPGDVEMTDGVSVAVQDDDSFGTAGDATITTTVKPESGVVIRDVLYTDATGTHKLTGAAVAGGWEYSYQMKEHDVDITVIFDNDDDPDVEKMYLAIVEKTGDGLDLPDNTAAITNTTNPALPKGDIWTGIYGETPKQRLQVDVTTANTYYAVITAKTKDATGADVSVPVLQLGNTGADVTAYIDVPSHLYHDVIITVEYKHLDTPPTDQYDLSLKLVDPNADTANTADIDTAAPLHVDGVADTDGPTAVTVGTALNVTTNVAVGYLKQVELQSNGITTVLTTTDPVTGFAMPSGDATVIVTLLEKDKRTPRPHDNRNDDNFPGGVSDPQYIDGYLKGDNLGQNRALIQVPNLYDKTQLPTTVPAFDEPDKKYEYKLYLKNGGSYVELKKGEDYDVVADGSYKPDPNNTTTGAKPHDDTGWELTIRSLKGESALTQLLLDGGVLYITATDVTDPAKPLAESEYVEVVLPAGPIKPDPDDPTKGYKATLRVVDNSGVPGNFAGMYIDAKTPVEYPNATYPADGSPVDAVQGDITGLRGDETVRTTAKAAPGARISAVTVTDSAGTRLLPEVPDNMDPRRFPYYMTGEDVIVTVYFEAQENPADPDDPDDTRYIAAVAKYGAIAVSGNEAWVENTTRNDLGKEGGSAPHWAEGYEKNKMTVTITVAAGYYAEIEAIKKTDGSKFTLTPASFGPGGGPYTVEIEMPASDVQINVNFVRELTGELRPYDPDNTGSTLYADHWITSENQGDRLVVVVPELNKDDGSEDTEVDKTAHGFHFYMEVDGNDAESLEYVIDLSHPDPDNNPNGDPYENDIYYADPSTPAGTDPTKYHGARFVLTVKTDEAIDKTIDDLETAGELTAAAAAAAKTRAKELATLLRAIMDNAGTEESIQNGVDPDGDGTKTKARLYITHTDSNDAAFESEQIDFEIPRYYSLVGELESYAPAHIATLSLERFVDDGMGGGEYKKPDYSYSADAPYHMVVELSERVGNGLWSQDFVFKSSKLAGHKYQFVAQKAAHVTYKRPEVELAIAAATALGRYDAAALEFSFDSPIALIAGDVDGNQSVKFRDWDRLISYMYGPAEWTKTPDAQSGTADEWAMSVYNPDSGAYAADLNGDGRIDDRDELVLMDERNYNRSQRHYNSPKGLDLSAPATPSVAAFAMRSMRRMAPRMLMAAVDTPEDDDELAIPEWAAQLVRDGIRVPLWVMALLRQEREVPDWCVELLRQEREVPEWAIELLQAGETLPDWALALVVDGKPLPDWAQALLAKGEPLPPVGRDDLGAPSDKTYGIDKDTVIRPIAPGHIDSPVTPDPDDTVYTIDKDTVIIPIDGGAGASGAGRPRPADPADNVYTIDKDTVIIPIDPDPAPDEAEELREDSLGQRIPPDPLRNPEGGFRFPPSDSPLNDQGRGAEAPLALEPSPNCPTAGG